MVLRATLIAAGFALVVWAGAPPGRYTLGPNTVYDNLTRLTWEGDGGTSLMSFPMALAYCGSLGAADAGWRLPTVQELQTLVDVRAYMPAIDTSAFPGTAIFYYWTSTVVAAAPTQHWLVSFSNGNSGPSGPQTSNNVRCVR
jgi:hypothetical protein